MNTLEEVNINSKIIETMNSDQLEGKWKQIKGKFKQKYGDVTDNDTTFAEGKFDEMLGRLQEKTGKRKEELKREIEEW